MPSRNPTFQMWTWTVTCSCLSMWLATQTWGFDDKAPVNGISGVWPTVTPDGLSEEDFTALSANMEEGWKKWTQETSDLVKDLYEGKHPTVEEQQAAIQRLEVKLETLRKALSNSDYRSIFPQLQQLYSRLNPEVDLARAVLDTLTLDPQSAQTHRTGPALEDLQEAIGHLRTDLSDFRNGSGWVHWARLNELSGLQPDSPDLLTQINEVKSKLEGRESLEPEQRDFVSREPFLKLEDALAEVQRVAQSKGTKTDTAGLRDSLAKLLDAVNAYRDDPSAETEAAVRTSLDSVRELSPDGGAAIADAVAANFLNYNLRVFVSEGLINRFFSETRSERSQIRERVMEASVYGYQCTDVTTGIRLVPNSLKAAFDLELDGVIRSNANGYTSRATIHTVGYHTFRATKHVLFDGQNFYLSDGQVSARANNQAVGAHTRVSHVPILGRIANNIAIREANARNPQTNAMAMQRITQQVSSQLEQEAASQFANASKELQTKTYGPLRKYNLYPDVMQLSTTASELNLSSRLMDADEIGGSQSAPIAAVPSTGLVAQIHESLLTHAFDRLGLNGQEMTEDQVRELLESRLSEILGRPVSIPKPQNAAPEEEQAANTLVFDQNDPVRFTITDGVVTLIIRAGLKRNNGEDIPTQIISVPFTPTLQGDKIVLTRGNVGVKPVTRPPNVSAQVARAQIMRQKIQSALPEQTVDATFEIEQQNKTVKLTLIELIAQGGWLTLSFQ